MAQPLEFVGSCEFTAIISDADGDDMMRRAEVGLRDWIEEIGVRRGDYAVVVDQVDGPLACCHELAAVVPAEIADEVMDVGNEHEVAVGDQIVIVRRRQNA